MTESEWLASEDPESMRQFLVERWHDRNHNRKLRLWACACCRRIWHLVSDPRCHRAVELAERHADGEASRDELERVGRDAGAADNEDYDRWVKALYAAGGDEGEGYQPHEGLMEATSATSAFVIALSETPENDLRGYPPSKAASMAVDAVVYSADPRLIEFTPGWSAEREVAYRQEVAAQAQLFRDIFGNPFRDVVAAPTWFTADVVAVARQIYESRDFSAMPILADALQDAGCDNEDIIAHCHNDGPHVRGCWVVDLLLAKSNSEATATPPGDADLPFSAATLDILRSAERMELSVLRVVYRDDEQQTEVVGSGWVEDAADRMAFIQQFLTANWYPDEVLMCFDAEYRVRLLAPGGEVEMDFCFSCSNVSVSGPDGGTGIIPFERGPSRLVRRLARKVGAARPWWRRWL